MEKQKFENMVQVLTYLSEQCELFTPMLEGVNSLQTENLNLKKQVEEATITGNRIQLNSTFAADYANFGVATVKKLETDAENGAKALSKIDLYNLIKAVIDIGKENYVRSDMEYKLDFYSMTDRIDFDQYIELWDLIASQHNSPEEEVPPTTDGSEDTTAPEEPAPPMEEITPPKEEQPPTEEQPPVEETKPTEQIK